MSLILKGGNVFYENEFKKADIFIKNGRIEKITNSEPLNGKDRKIINVENKFVIPGCIDPHVHIYKGKEDYISASKAALCGGYTTIMLMPFGNGDSVTSPKIYEKKKESIKKELLIDFSIHAGASAINQIEISKFGEKGIFTFKIFLPHSSPDFPAPENEYELIDILNNISKIGGLALIHAENRVAVELFTRKYVMEGKTQPSDFMYARPVFAEVEAVTNCILFAKLTNCPIYFVHISSGTASDIICLAKNSNQLVFAETCPQYLFLNESIYEKMGSLARVIPPIRSKDEQEKLWTHLINGIIDTIGTDHCPMPLYEKSRNIFYSNNGIPGLETALILLLNEINKNKIEFRRVIELMSSNPAKIFGLYPKKGVIRKNSQADLCIIDMDKKAKISIDKLYTKGEFTLYEGMIVKGVPIMTIFKGEVVMENGFPGEINIIKNKGEFVQLNFKNSEFAKKL
ncbi:MAG: dihydroorotase [Candidatus Helarchaeota archaeon]